MSAHTDLDSRWYVIKTARFKENYVGGQLGAIVGSEAYVPLARVPSPCRKRGQGQIEPLFPGYVFARLDLNKQLLALRCVHALHSLVTFDGQPASVDAAIIEGLRRREGGRGYIPLAPATVAFQAEEPVRVIEGPFRGLVGRFVRYEDSTARICLFMDFITPQAPGVWTFSLDGCLVERTGENTVHTLSSLDVSMTWRRHSCLRHIDDQLSEFVPHPRKRDAHRVFSP